MRLGIIVRSDMTGLGLQTKAYHKHLKPAKTIVVDISGFNGMPNCNWYSDPDVYINGMPTGADLDNILEGIDVLLTAETVYNLDLYQRARSLGVKTICVENPEFYDHILYPEYGLPDMMILPSVWMESEIREHAEPLGVKVVQLHHPVDRDDFPFRQRTQPTFMHVAGRPAVSDRNGTYDFMQACPDGVVTTLDSDLAWQLRRQFRHSTVHTEIDNPKELYDLADVMVLPRRYAGNCLPLNEALSCGMPVIMTDISPNNHLLPSDWLVPAHKIEMIEPRSSIDVYQADPAALADKLEEFRHRDIARESQKANEIAQSISWEVMLPKWQKAIESVL